MKTKSLSAAVLLALVSISVSISSSATTPFGVTAHTSATTLSSLMQRIVGSTPYSDAKLNGHLSSSPDLSDALPTTGYFEGGEDLVGVSDGLVLTADANPTNLGVQNISGGVGGASSSAPDLPGVLYDLASTALSAGSVESASTLEFTLTPTSDFFKLTFSLVVSEVGSFSNGQWDPSGEVFSYPDGIAILVKEAGTAWDVSQNCAVIPTTGTFISMGTAGIVDRVAGDVAAMRVAAQSNYDTLVAPTLVAGYTAPNPLPQIPADIAVPKIAYSTEGELGIGDTFMTVPMTCVVDVSTAPGDIEIGIVIANLNDDAVPPAVLIAGDSVGFSNSIAPVISSPAVVPEAPAPYSGPVLQDFSSRTLDPCTPKSITITGTSLSGGTASIQGKSVTVLENTDTKLVLAFPAGLSPGSGVDLEISSASGRLIFQDAFDIPANTCSLELSKRRWTRLQSDGKTVKMYAEDPVGEGKIQFFVDGKEIAWINAVDESDPKLSFASSNPYLVRSVELKPGKNRFEIKLDGVRVWRATYVPKG